jgi:hypothetical protein
MKGTSLQVDAPPSFILKIYVCLETADNKGSTHSYCRTITDNSYSSPRVSFVLLDIARFFSFVDDVCLSSFIKMKIT